MSVPKASQASAVCAQPYIGDKSPSVVRDARVAGTEKSQHGRQTFTREGGGRRTLSIARAVLLYIL